MPGSLNTVLEEAIYDVLIVAAVFQYGVKIFLADVDLSFYSRNNF